MDDNELFEKFYRWASEKWVDDFLSLSNVSDLLEAWVAGYRLKEREVNDG